MKSKNKRWTNEEELVIISMRAEKKSLKEIAKALNRTEGAVSMRCCKLIDECKLEKTTKSKINYEELAKYASHNVGNIKKGLRQYSEEYDIPYYTVQGAYYKKRKHRTRAKDIIKNNIVMFGRGGVITNSKNSDETPNKNTLWHTIKGWLLSHLLS